MAELAKWGDITFSVNSEKVFSFNNMKRSYSARWKSHNMVDGMPRMEYQGRDANEVTIDVILDAELGVNPLVEMEKFKAAAESGKTAFFYVGGKKVSVFKLYIASGTENWEKIWNQGELVRATVSLTFKEYK